MAKIEARCRTETIVPDKTWLTPKAESPQDLNKHAPSENDFSLSAMRLCQPKVVGAVPGLPKLALPRGRICLKEIVQGGHCSVTE